MHLYDILTSRKKKPYVSVVMLLAIVALAIGLLWGTSQVYYLLTDAHRPRELKVQMSGKPMPNVMDIPVIPGATNVEKSTTTDSFDYPVYHLSYDTTKSVSEVSAYYDEQLTKMNWESGKAAGLYSNINDPIFGQGYRAVPLTSQPTQFLLSYGVAIKARTTSGVTRVQVNYGKGSLLFTK